MFYQISATIHALKSFIFVPETEVNTLLPCQPDTELNTLLVQMLVALHPYLILHQQQQQQPTNWLTSSNELYATTPEPIATTIVTSSIVSTLTQTIPKVISIWFRNERIPTTIYSQRTTVLTDYITTTSTLRGTAIEPTERVRGRRDVSNAMLLDSSLTSEYDDSQFKTQPISQISPLAVEAASALPAIWSEPRVSEAWNNLLDALKEAEDNLKSK